MSDLLSDTVKEKPPDIKLTKKGTLVYGEFSREKLIDVLTNKLARRDKPEFLSVCGDAPLESLRRVIHSGIYSERVLQQLEGRGVPPRVIARAMKYGLLGLTPEELRHFEDLGVESKDVDVSAQRFDDGLTRNLIVAGLSEDQCRSVVTCGLISQNGCVLRRLLSSGVDVPGILTWPGGITPATPTTIGFLRTLGVNEDVVRYVEENGIDDEAEDMLIDLGYNEYEEMLASEARDLII